MNEHTQERNCSYAECLQEEARCSPIQKHRSCWSSEEAHAKTTHFVEYI